MNKKTLLLVTVIGFGASTSPNSIPQAQAAECSFETDVYQRCGQEFRDAFRNTIRYPRNDISDTSRRVRGAYDALRNCVNCAMDNVKDGMDRLTSPGRGDRSRAAQ